MATRRVFRTNPETGEREAVVVDIPPQEFAQIQAKWAQNEAAEAARQQAEAARAQAIENAKAALANLPPTASDAAAIRAHFNNTTLPAIRTLLDA